MNNGSYSCLRYFLFHLCPGRLCYGFLSLFMISVLIFFYNGRIGLVLVLGGFPFYKMGRVGVIYAKEKVYFVIADNN